MNVVLTGLQLCPWKIILVNKLVYVKRKDANLSPQAEAFIGVMSAYFAKYKP